MKRLVTESGKNFRWLGWVGFQKIKCTHHVQLWSSTRRQTDRRTDDGRTHQTDDVAGSLERVDRLTVRDVDRRDAVH